MPFLDLRRAPTWQAGALLRRLVILVYRKENSM
jgi:hypothetical protein